MLFMIRRLSQRVNQPRERRRRKAIIRTKKIREREKKNHNQVGKETGFRPNCYF